MTAFSIGRGKGKQRDCCIESPDGGIECAVVGDWVVKEEDETCFVLKAETFAATYEPAV
jgi:hypothetical protein